MHKFAGIALAVGMLVLTGCAAQQENASENGIQSVQELSLKASDKECRERAINMTSGNNERGWFGGGWQQQSYYEWCMENKGYTRDEYKDLSF